jgi:hypothetical protein
MSNDRNVHFHCSVCQGRQILAGIKVLVNSAFLGKDPVNHLNKLVSSKLLCKNEKKTKSMKITATAVVAFAGAVQKVQQKYW